MASRLAAEGQIPWKRLKQYAAVVLDDRDDAAEGQIPWKRLKLVPGQHEPVVFHAAEAQIPSSEQCKRVVGSSVRRRINAKI